MLSESLRVSFTSAAGPSSIPLLLFLFRDILILVIDLPPVIVGLSEVMLNDLPLVTFVIVGFFWVMLNDLPLVTSVTVSLFGVILNELSLLTSDFLNVFLAEDDLF